MSFFSQEETTFAFGCVSFPNPLELSVIRHIFAQ